MWTFIWISLVIIWICVTIFIIKFAFNSLKHVLKELSYLGGLVGDVSVSSSEQDTPSWVESEPAISAPFSTTLRNHLLRKIRKVQKNDVKVAKREKVHNSWLNINTSEYYKKHFLQDRNSKES